MKLRKNLKRTASLLMCFVIFMGLYACGSQGTAGNQSTTTKNQSTAVESANASTGNESSSTATKFATKEKFVVSTTDLTYPGDFNDKLANYVKEKFNVEFQFNVIERANWDEKLTIAFSSGDIADITDINIAPININKIKSWANAGLIQPLPENLSAYPNLDDLRSNSMKPYYDGMKINNKDYFWLVLRNCLDKVSPVGIMYRKDWAEAIGKRNSNDQYTYSEFAGLLRDIVKQDPGKVGAKKLVGYVETSWALGYLAAPLEYHQQWENYDKVNDRYTWMFFTDAKKEQFRFMNQLYKDGVYWQDFYTGQDLMASFITSGTVAAFQNYLSNTVIGPWVPKFEQANPGKKFMDCYAFARITGADGKEYGIYDPLYYGGQLYSSKLSPDRLARLLSIQDWVCSEEGQNMLTYGFEGEDWEKGADGTPQVLWKKDSTTGNFIVPYAKTTLFKRIAAENRKIDFFVPQYDAALMEANLERYQRRIEDTKNGNYVGVRAEDTVASDHYLGPIKEKYSDLSAETTPELTKLIVSKNYDAEYDAFVAKWKDIATQIGKELDDGLLKK